jgi:hypothetical protein
MNIELTLPNNSILEFEPRLPLDCRGALLRGAIAISANTSLAKIVLQQLTGDNYFIRLTTGKFLKRISAKGWTEEYGQLTVIKQVPLPLVLPILFHY